MKSFSFTSLLYFFVIPFSLLVSACGGDLSEQTLAKWKNASDSAKHEFVIGRFPADADFVKNCITRMSMLPDTDTVRVLDAGEMCVTGLRLKERNAVRNVEKNAAKKK